MKRVPSFSGRPGFPSGLQVQYMFGDGTVTTFRGFLCSHAFAQVLLVEADTQSREKVSKQLQQLTYVGKRMNLS